MLRGLCLAVAALGASSLVQGSRISASLHQTPLFSSLANSKQGAHPNFAFVATLLPGLRQRHITECRPGVRVAAAFSSTSRSCRNFFQNHKMQAGKEEVEPSPDDPRFDDWMERSSAKAEMLERAYALQTDVFTTDRAVLRNKAGEVVKPETLRGKSVALYFASGWCPDCVKFVPYLRSYYEEQRDKIEIVFVSSDFSEADALQHFQRSQGDWLMLDYNSPLRDEYKLRYGVWAGKEAAKFGTSIAAFKGRKSGIPALVVIGLDGEPSALLDAERKGLEALLTWHPEDCAWSKTV